VFLSEWTFSTRSFSAEASADQRFTRKRSALRSTQRISGRKEKFRLLAPATEILRRGESGAMISPLLLIGPMSWTFCFLNAIEGRETPRIDLATLQFKYGSHHEVRVNGSLDQLRLGTEKCKSATYISIHQWRDVRAHGSAFLPAGAFFCFFSGNDHRNTIPKNRMNRATAI